MPRYKAIKPGYMNKVLCKPGGKHEIVQTDMPLKPVPSWLQEIPEETAAQKKKRIAAEKKAGKEAEKKAEQDKNDTDSVTFIEPSGTDIVETL